MASPAPPVLDEPEAPEFLTEALLDLLEAIREPATISLPGGRIAAVNRAVARLADLPAVGRTIGELIEYYRARSSCDGPLVPGDLPSVRALRGEIVAQGERIDVTLSDGSVYHALVTSTPIIVDGKVVAALSVWHDFGAYVRDLAERSGPPDANGPADGQ